MDISIIIINWNTKDLLLDCLNSVFHTVRDCKNSVFAFEIWVVDNASSDGSVEAVRAGYPDIHIIENKKNLGFAAANNLAFRQMKGRYALLLNTDTILTDGAVYELFHFMETNPSAAVACGQLLNSDGSKQNSIANFPSLLTLMSNETLLRILFPKKFPSKRKTYTEPTEIESAIGACMIVRKKAMDEVGFFDEQYFFFFEETDWQRQMKHAGWKIYFIPTARIFHFQGKSAGHGIKSRIMFYQSRYKYLKKWHPRSFPLMCGIIFIRLLINAILSLAGILFTLGLKKNLNKKFVTYVQLILWHFKSEKS